LKHACFDINGTYAEAAPNDALTTLVSAPFMLIFLEKMQS